MCRWKGWQWIIVHIIEILRSVINGMYRIAFCAQNWKMALYSPFCTPNFSPSSFNGAWLHSEIFDSIGPLRIFPIYQMWMNVKTFWFFYLSKANIHFIRLICNEQIWIHFHSNLLWLFINCSNPNFRSFRSSILAPFTIKTFQSQAMTTEYQLVASWHLKKLSFWQYLSLSFSVSSDKCVTNRAICLCH